MSSFLIFFHCRSWQGPLAFGCQNFVVVLDTHTAQRLQTLVLHKTDVTKVAFDEIILRSLYQPFNVQ